MDDAAEPTSSQPTSSVPSQHVTDQLYMQVALRLAAYALALDEVPVACLIVGPQGSGASYATASNGATDPFGSSAAADQQSGNTPTCSSFTSHRSFFPAATDSRTTSATARILSTGINATNVTKNATRHCEMLALDALLIGYHSAHGQAFNQHNAEVILADCTLYVTVEPCIMCASALLQAGVGCIVYGAANERFGGMSGAVMKLQPQGDDSDGQSPVIRGGICSSEAINLLQEFYRRGNPNAPDEKRTRPLVERPRSAVLVQQPQ